MMALNVEEMVALTAQLKRLGVEEFKAGSFAVRFGQAIEEQSKPFLSPPSNEFKLPFDDETDNEGYTEEDLLASAQ